MALTSKWHWHSTVAAQCLLCLGLCLTACSTEPDLESPSQRIRATGRDLSDRIVVDGWTHDFGKLEAIFANDRFMKKPEEPYYDSKWGLENDISQIRITWDKDSLYLAGEGVLSHHNMVIWLDVVPDRGLLNMQALNSWRRNVMFSEDFAPDVFLATWDGNVHPRLLVHASGDQVQDRRSGEGFRSVATFETGEAGRAMEAAIPWNTLFLGTVGLGTVPQFAPALGETLQTFPPSWSRIKIAGMITHAADGLGGPDSAPDNSQGHTYDPYATVLIDNYAIVDLDLLDDSGLGGGGPDGVADWGVLPKARVQFRFDPIEEKLRAAGVATTDRSR